VAVFGTSALVDLSPQPLAALITTTAPPAPTAVSLNLDGQISLQVGDLQRSVSFNVSQVAPLYMDNGAGKVSIGDFAISKVVDVADSQLFAAVAPQGKVSLTHDGTRELIAVELSERAGIILLGSTALASLQIHGQINVLQGDQVLVGFQAGDINNLYLIGSTAQGDVNVAVPPGPSQTAPTIGMNVNAILIPPGANQDILRILVNPGPSNKGQMFDLNLNALMIPPGPSQPVELLGLDANAVLQSPGPTQEVMGVMIATEATQNIFAVLLPAVQDTAAISVLVPPGPPNDVLEILVRPGPAQDILEVLTPPGPNQKVLDMATIPGPGQDDLVLSIPLSPGLDMFQVLVFPPGPGN
jgi:hypothetical protein